MELVWQDAVCLLEKLGVGPVHFVGLSMGGFTALRMAARRPDLVRSLVIIESSAGPEPIENVARYRMLVVATRLVGPKALRARIAPIMLGASILADPARRSDVDRFVAIMSRRKDIWRAVNGVIDRAGMEAEVGRIRTRTLVIVGDEDVATPRAKAEALVAAIAGARLVCIPRAGHSSSVEEPAVVTAVVAGFLTEH